MGEEREEKMREETSCASVGFFLTGHTKYYKPFDQ